MDTLICQLRQKATEAIARALGLPEQEAVADISLSTQQEFGHYQCNSALRLGKTLRCNPRLVAEKIVHEFDASLCSKIEIAGPGFINFTVSSEILSSQLQEQLSDPLVGAALPRRKEKIVIDFSSPNVAKELHVGHIRSTIIGDCIARLFEFLGHDVLRLNHIGDWGTQFGMLITYMKEAAPNVLIGKEDTTLELLMQWYRAAKKKFDEDPDFKKRSQMEVVRLQSGDKESLFAWQAICDISRKGFQEIYNLLDVSLVERGESFYNPFLKSVVDEFEKKGLLTVSDGAKCVYLDQFKNREGDPLPLIIQKSDGGYNYDTTDLAALRHRIFSEKADRIIYITDAGQALHFQMIFAAAEKIGWMDFRKVALDHLGFGFVLGSDGKKFKTRSGETEKLIDLLSEAIERAKKIVDERLPEANQMEKDRLAYALGIGAVKYSDLSVHRSKDYVFSYDKMLRFEGNTAVFLLYAYVRIIGIKRKTKADIAKILAEHKISLSHPTEVALGIHLRRFGEILEIMAKDLCPNRLTDYLYELAEKFHAFFRDCRVEGSPEEGSRLLLCELASKVLAKGLFLLGMKTVERM